jgi:hypothetical protein
MRPVSVRRLSLRCRYINPAAMTTLSSITPPTTDAMTAASVLAVERLDNGVSGKPAITGEGGGGGGAGGGGGMYPRYFQ